MSLSINQLATVQNFPNFQRIFLFVQSKTVENSVRCSVHPYLVQLLLLHQRRLLRRNLSRTGLCSRVCGGGSTHHSLEIWFFLACVWLLSGMPYRFADAVLGLLFFRRPWAMMLWICWKAVGMVCMERVLCDNTASSTEGLSGLLRARSGDGFGLFRNFERKNPYRSHVR